jgi:hypothetical protein
LRNNLLAQQLVVPNRQGRESLHHGILENGKIRGATVRVPQASEYPVRLVFSRRADETLSGSRGQIAPDEPHMQSYRRHTNSIGKLTLNSEVPILANLVRYAKIQLTSDWSVCELNYQLNVQAMFPFHVRSQLLQH